MCNPIFPHYLKIYDSSLEDEIKQELEHGIPSLDADNEDNICEYCGNAKLVCVGAEEFSLCDGDGFPTSTKEVDYFIYRCPECGELFIKY